jgi:hypothetical protein
MDIEILTEAVRELRNLPMSERRALYNAFEKLRASGARLPYPHCSQVRTSRLRELRPRAGRSPWRALYQQVGDRIVVLAIVPEAMHDPKSFDRGVRIAEDRLLAVREQE